ncbi:MAG: preprotein translocase subunit SecE [Rhodothermales bacterium]
MNKIKAYIEEVVKEMQKVSWPKQQELVSNTAITLVATAIISMLFFGADRLIGLVLENIYLLAG